MTTVSPQDQAMEALRSLSLRDLRSTENVWQESGNELKIEGRPAVFWVVEQAVAARKQNDPLRVRALATLSWLLKTGVSTEIVYKGNTPLMEAAGEGDIACVRRLLAAGASLSASSLMGNTALHWAAIGGRPAVCKLLISQGADLEKKNHDRRTPLHCAADRLRMNTITVLHEAGAEWTGVDVYDRTVLETIAHHDRSLAKAWKNRPERDRLARETPVPESDQATKPTRSRRL
jgi:hypothetical protein